MLWRNVYLRKKAIARKGRYVSTRERGVILSFEIISITKRVITKLYRFIQRCFHLTITKYSFCPLIARLFSITTSHHILLVHLINVTIVIANHQPSVRLDLLAIYICNFPSRILMKLDRRKKEEI